MNHRFIKTFLEKNEASMDQEQAESLAAKVLDMLDRLSGPLAELRADLILLCELVRDYVRGEYRDIPWSSIAMVAAALAYIVLPIDAIPDVIPFIGWVDDAGVIAMVLKALRNELGAYRAMRGI